MLLCLSVVGWAAAFGRVRYGRLHCIMIRLDLLSSDFVTVPSPPVLIVTMEERHVYMCNHSETTILFWTVNGSILNFEIFPIEIDASTRQLPGSSRVYTLEIGGRLDHNRTTIQCSARLSDGSEVTTPCSVLHVYS